MRQSDYIPAASSRLISAAIISAGILAFGLLCGLLPLGGGHARVSVLTENAAVFYDSSRYIRVHRGILLATLAAALTLLRWRGTSLRIGRLVVRPWLGRAGRAVALAASLAVVLLASIEAPNLKWAVVVTCCVATFVWVGSCLADRASVSVVAFVFLLGCAAILIVPGFAKVPDLSSPDFVPPDEAEVHYSIVVSQGDWLSQGEHLFTEVAPHYGFLEPLVLAAVEQAHGLLSFGAHVRVIQIMQVAFALAAFFCYWLWSRRNMLATVFVLLPILAWVHTTHKSVLCPNQSGWRFIGFPLGLLLLVAARPSRRLDALLLGLAAGGLVILNPETGIVMAAAYATYVIAGRVRTSLDLRSLVSALTVFGLSATVIPLVFVLVYRITLGYLPFPVSRGPSYALTKFASGYGGLEIYFGIGWIVILIHSVFEIGRALVSIEALTSQRRIRLAIAVAILIWFAYFANRPHPWNLWTYWFLYGFFVLDFCRPRRLARCGRWIRRGRLPMPLGIMFMFTAMGLFLIIPALRGNLRLARSRIAPADTTVLSGVRLPSSYADLASQRADFVRQQKQKGSLLYFTSNTYLMPILSGVVCDLPFSDPYVEGFTVEDFDRSVTAIEAKHPQVLLFDDPSSQFVGVKQRQTFIERLKVKLSPVYQRTERRAGWEIWTLRAS